MAYKIKARYYADSDQLGESYVITSDNSDKDTRFEIGEVVKITRAQPEDSADQWVCKKCGLITINHEWEHCPACGEFNG